MVKSHFAKLATNNICQAGNVTMQADVLCAVADHPFLHAAHEIAGIFTSKEQAAAKNIFDQSAKMI